MAIKYINDIKVIGSIQSFNNADDTNKIELHSKSGNLSLQFINGQPCLVIDGKNFIIPLEEHANGGTIATKADVDNIANIGNNIESYAIDTDVASIVDNMVVWNQPISNVYTYPPVVQVYDGNDEMIICDVQWISGDSQSIIVKFETEDTQITPKQYRMTLFGKTAYAKEGYEAFDIPGGLDVVSNKVAWTVELENEYIIPPIVQVVAADGTLKMVNTFWDNTNTVQKLTATINVSQSPNAGDYTMIVYGK